MSTASSFFYIRSFDSLVVKKKRQAESKRQKMSSCMYTLQQPAPFCSHRIKKKKKKLLTKRIEKKTVDGASLICRHRLLFASTYQRGKQRQTMQSEEVLRIKKNSQKVYTQTPASHRPLLFFFFKENGSFWFFGFFFLSILFRAYLDKTEEPLGGYVLCLSSVSPSCLVHRPRMCFRWK